LVLAVTLSLGIDPNLLKLVTAVFVLGIVALPRVSGSLRKG
jgi:putative ABC transport system permease protein